MTTSNLTVLRKRARQVPEPVCQHNGGFTLIEMLVVIAILVILLSMLAPSISKMIYNAQSVRCRSNLRQLSTAAMSYANAHKGFLPDATWPREFEENGYLGSGKSVVNCPVPVDSDHFRNFTQFGFKLINPGWMYTLNIDLVSRSGWPNYIGDQAPIYNVREPAKCMFFSDGMWNGVTFPHWGDYMERLFFGRTDAAWALPSHPGKKMGNSGFPISQGVNVVYLDGHVGYVRWKGETNPSALKKNKDYPMNNPEYWGIPGTKSWILTGGE